MFYDSFDGVKRAVVAEIMLSSEGIGANAL